MLEFLYREAGAANRVDRRTVAVASAHHDPVDAVQPVLPTGKAGVLGAHVLDEQEPTAGFQHPPELGQRLGLVADGAQDERRDDDVEAVVRERQLLGRRSHELDRATELLGLALEALGHRRIWLDDG